MAKATCDDTQMVTASLKLKQGLQVVVRKPQTNIRVLGPNRDQDRTN